MQHIESFGIIPLSHDQDGWRVCVVLHKNGAHWGFPKGRKESGEDALTAATRELKEEVGLAIVRRLQDLPLIEHYQFQRDGALISKTVTYFLALVAGELHLQEAEIREARWVTLEEARHLLTFQEGRAVVEQVIKMLR